MQGYYDEVKATTDLEEFTVSGMRIYVSATGDSSYSTCRLPKELVESATSFHVSGSLTFGGIACYANGTYYVTQLSTVTIDGHEYYQSSTRGTNNAYIEFD